MLDAAAELRDFAAACEADGLVDCVLLGMGGSSLGPEVLRRSFGDAGGLRLQVLDSTDPGAILELERSLDLQKTLFLVSSKSGGTIETLSQYRYFRSRVDDGSHFVAITDPGSGLAEIAEREGFRRAFLNDPEIGGRYSVLSYFGMVPAALMGANVEAILHRSQVAEQNCSTFGTSASNSGLWLGLVLGELALQGRDKLTFVVDEPISSFGLWAEQLIAESLGKQGKGTLPIADEPLGPPDAYGPDRAFVHLRNADEPDEAAGDMAVQLARAGFPVITVMTHGAIDLGRVFFFAEFGTAVAGWVLGVNAFDQPDVQAAKDATARVLDHYAKEGALPEQPQHGAEQLRSLLAGAEPPAYVAIHGYVRPSEAFDRAVARLRALVRDRTKAATTFGYGPRFLHSTGQFHKGGPQTGKFVQLLHDGGEDVDVPDAGYSFGTLKNAQAIGDFETLRARGLQATRTRLEGDDPAAALEALTDQLEGML
jgi:transaldolase / glucose-6-phosphate isomerase